MLSALLLVVVTAQTDPSNSLRKAGIQLTAPIRVTDGRARLPGGQTIELVGACYLTGPGLKPWDARGNPVSAADARWFWRAIGEKASEISKPGPREEPRFAVGFRVKGEILADTPMFWRVRGSASQFSPPDDEFPFATMGFKMPIKGSTLDMPFEVTSRKSVDLFTVDPANLKKLPKSISATVQSQLSEGFTATQTKRETLKLRNYIILMTLPKAWKGLRFQMRADDTQKGAPARENVGYETIGVDGEALDPSYKGKVAFVLRTRERPGYRRKFIVSSQPSWTVEFGGIPTRATYSR